MSYYLHFHPKKKGIYIHAITIDSIKVYKNFCRKGTLYQFKDKKCLLSKQKGNLITLLFLQLIVLYMYCIFFLFRHKLNQMHEKKREKKTFKYLFRINSRHYLFIFLIAFRNIYIACSIYYRDLLTKHKNFPFTSFLLLYNFNL